MNNLLHLGLTFFQFTARCLNGFVDVMNKFFSSNITFITCFSKSDFVFAYVFQFILLLFFQVLKQYTYMIFFLYIFTFNSVKENYFSVWDIKSSFNIVTVLFLPLFLISKTYVFLFGMLLISVHSRLLQKQLKL